MVTVSVPMLKATERMKAAKKSADVRHETDHSNNNLPHPKLQPNAVDKIIALGTATFAFFTSSLM